MVMMVAHWEVSGGWTEGRFTARSAEIAEKEDGFSFMVLGRNGATFDWHGAGDCALSGRKRGLIQFD